MFNLNRDPLERFALCLLAAMFAVFFALAARTVAASPLSGFPLFDPAIRAEVEFGHWRVAKAMKAASPEFRSAIREAIEEVDPAKERPWLEREMYRICLREARCGQFGNPGLHVHDGWTGEKSYARAVERGRLEPETCPGHALEGRSLADFATRGGWGVNAARGLRYLDGCHAPEELDDPRIGALVAARMLSTCTQGRIACTCSERAALWIGPRTLRNRPLWALTRKSRVSSVASHCGDRYAAIYGLTQLVTSPARWAKRHLL